MNCKEAKERNEATLLRIPGVHAVGLGKDVSGRQCIRVFCDHPADDTDPGHHNPPIPTTLDGFPVAITPVTPLFAFLLDRRQAPVEGGYSVGHFAITAGTVGIACEDAIFPQVSASRFPLLEPIVAAPQPNPIYILSNNHVLANSNNARIGDPILQPGPIDGGTIAGDTIGNLARYIPIQFTPAVPLEQQNNFVDAAVAEVEFNDVERKRIRSIGYVHAWRPKSFIRVDDIVQKTGRTTDHSYGRVLSIDTTVDVGYGEGKTARFKGQIVTTAMAAGGDSGSLGVSAENVAVGLLFAGSTEVTIFNPIEDVQRLLKISVADIREVSRDGEPAPPPPPPPSNGGTTPPPGTIPPHKHPIAPGPGETGPAEPAKV